MQEQMLLEACPGVGDWESCESELNTVRFRVIRVER